MIKLCHYKSVNPHGMPVVDLVDPGGPMVKTASPYLPEVQQYIADLQPRAGSVYALVNAIGAFDAWSSNINGDGVPERYDAGHAVYEQLIHKGPVWGYETFLGAHPFTHHVNKDPAKALGVVELSVYNKLMKRVELVVRIDRDKCITPAANRVLGKIDNGELPDVSMGLKTPFDLCSICTDWDSYNTALRTFDPLRHRHPGVAVLAYHKTIKPIRGLSIKETDYCNHLRHRRNHVLDDGRKIFMWNHWIRFFDLSFVFIGAERQCKMMARLAEGKRSTARTFGPPQGGWPSASDDMAKTASIHKAAKVKKAVMYKDAPPSQFEGKAVPLIRRSERDLPREILNEMGQHSLSDSLSSATTLGMLLKPREFQRVTLMRLGVPEMADELDHRGMIFPRSRDVDSSVRLHQHNVLPRLIRVLMPYLANRSCFGPPLRRRMIHIRITGLGPQDHGHECDSPLLSKIGSAYNGYCDQMIEKIADLSRGLRDHPEAAAQVMGFELEDIFSGPVKRASIDPRDLLGSIPTSYLAALAQR